MVVLFTFFYIDTVLLSLSLAVALGLQFPCWDLRASHINMDALERIMSRPVAKPYRNKGVKDSGPPHLNDRGLLDFSPDDIESKCSDFKKLAEMEC